MTSTGYIWTFILICLYQSLRTCDQWKTGIKKKKKTTVATATHWPYFQTQYQLHPSVTFLFNYAVSRWLLIQREQSNNLFSNLSPFFLKNTVKFTHDAMWMLCSSPSRHHTGCGPRRSTGQMWQCAARRLRRPAHTVPLCCRVWSRSTGPCCSGESTENWKSKKTFWVKCTSQIPVQRIAGISMAACKIHTENK